MIRLDLGELKRQGFLICRLRFSADLVWRLRAAVQAMVEYGQRGEIELSWIDRERGLPDRTEHMLMPDKYDDAFGAFLEEIWPDLQALLRVPVRHSLFGMLTSGGGRPYTQSWHRDLGKPAAADEDKFLRRFHNRCVQFNAPLIEGDRFLQIVPGSHLRASTQTEIEAARDGVGGEMPHGETVELEPGDVVYYNPNLWHRGWNPEGALRWTLHAAYWRTADPVMTHEQGQRDALSEEGHLDRFPQSVRQLVQGYLDSYPETPRSLQEL
ncbi:MAG: phytanoyl-CoA dioxygenase family protein [Candidatus Latescibacterota bacterium]|nr:phytanoyl-CoA dioxygenase family protein [Candidatus Latescibacterota bacterium]